MKLTLLFLCSAALLLCQVDTGTVSGLVTDESGAIVPGARVVVTQLDTNVQSDLRTNDSGLYTATALRPGRYQVSVTKDGFQSQKSQSFDLRVQDRAEVNFRLQVGATSSEITVSAAAPLLESETSSLGQVIQEKTVNDLPLNGRNFIQLATLTAGTLPSTRTPERDNFISNGARAVQNSYLLDGIDNKNRIMGFDKSSAQIVQPIIDAIQEFKVQTSTFSAEFGQAAGGVVNVTLRSGTNDFHGDIFEFLRNSVLDATPYFQPAGGGKPVFIQNQFGATFGGPIIRNRTFFFGSWQSSRELSAAPQTASVPTAAEHSGIFPSRITNPATGQPFPRNTIPTTVWDSTAALLMRLYPLPNLPGAVNNFSYNPKERVNADEYNVRIDHHFGANDYIFGRVSQGGGQNSEPGAMPDPANQVTAVDLTTRQFMASETHTFSPSKLNEFRLGFVYSGDIQDSVGPRLFDQYGIRGALDAPNIKGLPNVAIKGFSSLGTIGPGYLPIPANGSNNSPATKSGKIWQLLDNFSWIHDRHSLKFGLDFERVTMFAYATNSARPGYTFNGTYTGNALGDFLLGDLYQGQTSQQQLDTIMQYVYNGYVQDDWKITNKLTLNLGLRYELPVPFTEAHGRQSNYVLNPGPCYRQLVTATQSEQCGVGSALVRPDTNNFAPRLGLAYQAAQGTVIRSGFGVFYGRDEDLGIQRRLPNNPPFVSSATFVGSQSTPAFALATGFPADALSLATPSSDVNWWPFDFPTPYVIQWNFNIEQNLGHQFTAQIGYTGSEAHKLPIIVNVNQAFPGTSSVNSRRPYQGVGNVYFYGPLDNSTYNALLAKLERRFSNGLNLLASYTYGHSIDGGGNQNDMNDPGPQNARDLSAQKGSSNFDIRQRFVLSGLYQLPFGKGAGFLPLVIRNWELSGIFSVQTGQPFTATLSTDPSGTGTTARPNRIADGNLPAGERTPTQWFDTSAFVAPTCVCFGNSGRDILIGPGLINLDFGVDRNFWFGERFHLQFRAEAFNVANHPDFALPASTIGSQGAGVISSVIAPERQVQFAMKLLF